MTDRENYNLKLKSIIFNYMDNSKPLSAVIIDDDSFSSLHLQDLIQHKLPSVEVVAVASDPENGLELIRDYSPDIVFLDIEMPGMDGFELLRRLPFIDFDVIFTTAHEHHAIRAIRYSAIDYLVKPVKAVDLQEAISRVKVKRATKQDSHSKQPEVFSDLDKKLSSLAIPTLEGFVFVRLEEIIFCEGSDKYTKVYLSNNKVVLSSKTLGGFEELLEQYNFYRIHKSHLINLNHLTRYIRGEGGQVCLSDGSTLSVSRRKKDGLIRIVSQFS